MSSYKVGDKFIIEIDKIFEQDGEKLYRAKGMKTIVFDNKGLRKLKPLEAEIMKLLLKNAELKVKIQKIGEAQSNFMNAVCDACEHIDSMEKARASGQQEAWELIQKIESLSKEEFQEAFGTNWYNNGGKITRFLSYAEAAARIKAHEAEHGQNQYEEKSEECNADEDCEICQYYERTADQYPCSHCRNCYQSKFKAKLGGRENENHSG